MPKTEEKTAGRTLEVLREESARVGEAHARLQEELASLGRERGAEGLEESRLQEEAMRAGKPAASSRKLDKLAQREAEIERQLSTVGVVQKKLEYERLALETQEAESLSAQLDAEYGEAEKAFRVAESRFQEAGFACRDHSQHVGDLERAQRRARFALAEVDAGERERLEEERREREEAAEVARLVHQRQAIRQRWAEAGFIGYETEEERQAIIEYAEANAAHTSVTFSPGGKGA